MFESDAKKILRQKHNKMAGISAATGRNIRSGQTPVKGNNASIYDELKLSEKLSYELNLIKSKVDELNESL